MPLISLGVRMKDSKRKFLNRGAPILNAIAHCNPSRSFLRYSAAHCCASSRLCSIITSVDPLFHVLPDNLIKPCSFPWDRARNIYEKLVLSWSFPRLPWRWITAWFHSAISRLLIQSPRLSLNEVSKLFSTCKKISVRCSAFLGHKKISTIAGKIRVLTPTDKIYTVPTGDRKTCSQA